MSGSHESRPPTAGAPMTNTSVLRAVNARALLRELRRVERPLTVRELAGATGLSRPTVDAGISELVAWGWALESESPSSSRGRPARRFEFAERFGLVVGVDLGPSRIDIRIADLHGTVLARTSPAPPAGEVLAVDVVAGEVLAALELVPGPVPALLGVSVGVPGVVGPDGDIAASFVLPHWAGPGPRARLEDRLGAPVAFENDANLAAIVEHAEGAGRGSDDMALLLVGNRVASGLVLGGRLHRGATGVAGEIGSLPEPRWREPRPELVEALRRLTPGTIAEADLLLGAFGAAPGTPAAAAVDRYIDELSMHLVAIALVADPALVVVGGGVAALGEPLRARLAEHFAAISLSRPRIALAHFVTDAVALGALRHALGAVDEAVFGF